MAIEGARSSLAALLFLTLLVLAASASGGADDAADAVEEHDPAADEEPYMLVAFHNKHGEEIRLLSDKGTGTLSPSGFANRSGHGFYLIRDRKGGNRRHRLPLLQSIYSNMSRESCTEDFWNTLGVLASSGDPDPATDDDDNEQGYVLIGMETSGGHMIRLVVVADQRYFFITGFAQGFFWPRIWSFRDGERHCLLPTLGGNGGSHAEVVASNVLTAMVKDGRKAAYYS